MHCPKVESSGSRFLARICACMALLLSCMQAAAQSCTNSNLTFNPPLNVLVLAGTSRTVYYGSIQATYTCSMPSGNSTVSLTPNVGTTSGSASNSGSVYAVANGVPTGSFSSGTCSLSASSNSASFSDYIFKSSIAQTCVAVISQSLILTSGTTISAGDAIPTNGAASINKFSAPTWRAYLAAPIPIYTTSCTVSPSSTAIPVSLPNVSVAALSAAGQTAGTTPFTLALTGCNNATGTTYGASAYWTFTQQGGANYIISNSATSPAANVGIELLDSSYNPIQNAGTSSVASAISSGAYSVTYYARYISTGVATSGNVKGVATFLMEYY